MGEEEETDKVTADKWNPNVQIRSGKGGEGRGRNSHGQIIALMFYFGKGAIDLLQGINIFI
jgi:hypothetical protein